MTTKMTAVPEDGVRACVSRLASADRHPLRDVPSLDTPRAPGVYALWAGVELLYVGIAYRDPRETTNPNAGGVWGRLKTYRDCRLTDDFPVAVAFRYIVPSLSEADRHDLAEGTATLRDMRALTQRWVWQNVAFSVALAPGPVAREAEKVIRASGLPGVGQPAFNPL